MEAKIVSQSIKQLQSARMEIFDDLKLESLTLQLVKKETKIDSTIENTDKECEETNV